MLSEFFIEGLEGQKVGSRVAVAASAETAFGEAGNAQLGIGNKDTVVAVIDLLTAVPEGPEGEEQDAPSWAPALQGDEAAPTGLDFAGTPKPGDSLQSAYLIEGEGEEVQKGQTIVVNYLGQVYGGKKPFDESYSAQPTSFQIGVGGVVKGWDQTLVGVPVGSRVIMAIPPELGYGEQGNPQAGIKGTDTLYFVVDVLGRELTSAGPKGGSGWRPRRASDCSSCSSCCWSSSASSPRRRCASCSTRTPVTRPSSGCSSATRTTCARSASRSRSGPSTRTSRTSPATGCAPTRHSCRRSS